jgi:hypothetical protein
MTPRERIIAAIEHRETDYVPYVIPMDPEVVGRLNEHYGSADWRGRIQGFFQGAGVGWGSEHEGRGPWTDAFGVVWEDAPGAGAWHSVEVPLKEPTLKGYQFPELLPDDELERMRETFSTQHDRYRHVNIGMMFFERAWALRGMQEILMDFRLHPEFAHELFERLMEIHLDLIDRLARLPIDAIRFGDDFGGQRGLIMGTPVWREFLKPRLARMYARRSRARSRCVDPLMRRQLADHRGPDRDWRGCVQPVPARIAGHLRDEPAGGRSDHVRGRDRDTGVAAAGDDRRPFAPRSSGCARRSAAVGALSSRRPSRSCLTCRRRTQWPAWRRYSEQAGH